MIEKTILEEMVAQVNIKTGENVITIDDVRNVLYGMSLDNVDYKMLDSFININRHISEGLLGHR